MPNQRDYSTAHQIRQSRYHQKRFEIPREPWESMTEEEQKEFSRKVRKYIREVLK